ncbi:MAG: DUF1553 domain-containing protein [Bryobacterales bacterium]|nr:DUF1553 domain-containing protein [Bryobacterales bacterium]
MRLIPLCFLLAAPLAAASDAEYFESNVRPLLAKHCYSCHTQTGLGGLRVDSREALLKGGGRGAAVEPRAPERSWLITAVRYEDEQLKMPPSGKLSDEEIEALTRWIDDGAVWPASDGPKPADDGKFRITEEHREFWAFQPVAEPAAGASIDALIQARLAEEGLQSTGPADKRTLLRRLYFDLIGLPPAPEDVDAFLADESPDAYTKVVDRLLDSPRYGERWGRLWLDVARYSDERLNSTQDEPYPNAFRYRDWVIRAFNQDMPYDLFVKASLAGDQLSEKERKGHSEQDLAAGLGFYGLSPQFQDDRIDATGKAFLGLTIGCAQCHDHKFDPIPTEDYYALLGVFNSTKLDELPLAPQEEVERYRALEKKASDAEADLNRFLDTQARALVDVLADRTADYLNAAYRVFGPEKVEIAEAAEKAGLDKETLERWCGYLDGQRNHPLLDDWNALVERQAPAEEVDEFARGFQALLVETIADKKRIDKENEIRLGGDDSARKAARTELLSLGRDEYFLWRDVASASGRALPVKAPSGVLYYKGEAIERFLSGVWTEHVQASRARAKELREQAPAKYPFLHVISDVAKPENEHVHIRGSEDNLGDEVPRRFLSVLCDGPPEPFQHGSGRLELARAIASPDNPLTARVMVNRIWGGHFGHGIVGTPSNFGMMGERPTNPELLDYLAARFVDLGWSVKALHREIVESEAYKRSAVGLAKNNEKDPDNRLLWRGPRRRLDVEELRDATLAVAGDLNFEAGGPPVELNKEDNQRRTVYGYVSRRKLDDVLALFDFPNPNSHAEQRINTNTPLQGLYFLNSDFLMREAASFSKRVTEDADSPAEQVARAYRLLFGRAPSKQERAATLAFLSSHENAWPQLAQVLMSSNEFLYVD